MAYREMDVLGRQIDHPVGGAHMHIDIRCHAREILQPRHQPLHREAGGATEPHHAPLSQRLQARGGVADQRQCLGAGRKVVAPRRGEREPARQPLEQRAAQEVLQPAHLLRYRARGHVQFRGRGAHAQVAGGRLEEAYGSKRGRRMAVKKN